MMWSSLEERAAYSLGRCVVDGLVPERLRPFAAGVVAVLLEAGLPMFDVEAADDGDDCGVELAVQDGAVGPVLRVVWHQRQTDMSTRTWRASQTAMHRALHAILAAGGYQLGAGQPPRAAPTVLPPPDPGPLPDA